jgi:3-oxoacyl-(acyl-carrier-protein) synthase
MQAGGGEFGGAWGMVAHDDALVEAGFMQAEHEVGSVELGAAIAGGGHDVQDAHGGLWFV